MILYRTEPYPLQMRNIMLLDDVESGGVVYVNKDTYDQALLLSGRMDGNPQRVLDVLKTPKNQVYVTMAGLKGLMDNLMKSMPKPLNMLAPFLIFCHHNQGIDWDAKNREMGYGILHQFSQLIDFNAVTTISADARATISLPTALINQYQTSWNELCSSLEDKIVLETPVVYEGPIKSADDEQNLEQMFQQFQRDVVSSVELTVREIVSRIPATMPIPMPMQVGNGAITQQMIQSQNVAPQTVQQQPSNPTPAPVQTSEPVKEQTPAPQTDAQSKEDKPTVTCVPADAPATQPAKEDAKNEDEKAADDIMAIIAAMKQESATRDKEREAKMKSIGASKPTEPSSAPTSSAIHTNARSTKEEASQLTEVLDEYDF